MGLKCKACGHLLGLNVVRCSHCRAMVSSYGTLHRLLRFCLGLVALWGMGLYLCVEFIQHGDIRYFL